LSAWFRDYLYIPLGGSRVPTWRWYANLVIIFLVSGLWHGANWTFVLWGGLHGLYYLLEAWTHRARDKGFEMLHLAKPAIRTTINTLITVNLICFAWLFFRANSSSDAFLLLNHMVQIRASTDIYAPWTDIVNKPGLQTAFALGLVALLAAIHVLREHKCHAVLAVWQRDWVRWVAYLLLALATMNLGIAKETPFVYLQF
jgi:D-alanyl-lipoteichoic acid acyltransferase DltB (MBOAT superfamily)